MAIVERELNGAIGSASTGPKRHHFSRQDYRAMADYGILTDHRIELIEGEIVDMAPIGDAHAAVTHPLAVILEAAFGSGYSVRNQAPVSLGPDAKQSEPQPDLAIVVGKWRDYLTRTPAPQDIVLVVEVADSSLDFDRTVKAKLYASADIAEYWIVNLVDGSLEVYRDPNNSEYQSVMTYRSGDQVAPLHPSAGTVAAADFLP